MTGLTPAADNSPATFKTGGAAARRVGDYVAVSEQLDGPPAPPQTVVKRKVCLVGEQAVGKSSLIRRFVTGAFDPRYVSTLGLCVVKKAVTLPGPEGSRVQVDMVILDIMGQRNFLESFKEAYFSGTSGVMAVFDLTRRSSLRDLGPWLLALRQAAGPIPVLAVGNKCDLTDLYDMEDGEIESVLSPLGIPVVRTSAKTGENVEASFVGLARMLAGADGRASD